MMLLRLIARTSEGSVRDAISLTRSSFNFSINAEQNTKN